jgi:uncharacterized membrane protein
MDDLPEDSPTNQLSSDVALKGYELLVETYQQHVDLMLKCIGIYVAIVGTVTGLIFSASVDPQRRVALSVFVALTSLITLVGVPSAFNWVRGIERPMRHYERTLGLDPFPLSGVRYIIWSTGCLALLILIGAIIVALTSPG